MLLKNYRLCYDPDIIGRDESPLLSELNGDP
jgi:hypothetical protein